MHLHPCMVASQLLNRICYVHDFFLICLFVRLCMSVGVPEPKRNRKKPIRPNVKKVRLCLRIAYVLVEL